MTIATSDSDGTPHAAPVYFAANDTLNLYFFSEGKSTHSQHIAQNPQVAAAIYPETSGWRAIKGLQIRGTARLVESAAEWEAAWERYQQKFPFVTSIKPMVSQNRLYVLIPHWIRLVDNSKEFGFKQEWKLT